MNGALSYFPRGGLSACGTGDVACPQLAAPVMVYPEQPLQALADEAAQQAEGSQPNYARNKTGELRHNEVITLVGASYYQFNGSFFVHLGEREFLSFSANPRFPLSDVFKWRFRKYPAIGTPDQNGAYSYQSRGYVIREGDNLFLDCVGTQLIVTHNAKPSPYNMPFCAAPPQDALLDFDTFGTQSPENVRLVSEDYDPSVPHDQQPPVKTDGSKAYFIEFTRTSQNLALYPGQSPAPNLLKTSAYRGDGTRFLILPLQFHYDLPATDNKGAGKTVALPDSVVVRAPHNDLSGAAAITEKSKEQTLAYRAALQKERVGTAGEFK